jgi:electron transfer flavoprotein alpha subunit
LDFAVLVKAVPPSERLQFDPELRRVDRAASPLLLNPFDSRAVRVALELRRPGEHVTAISLGPRAAESPLREVRAAGADRVVLVSDPVFAGSDTLATSRALVAVLSQCAHDVVLGGAWTTDSETGQVPPEVAELLGVPLLSGARSVRRDAERPQFEVTVDTPTGWARYSVGPPLLITVGEKIAKPLKIAPAEVDALPTPAVEVRDAASLGANSGRWGAQGSPTVVDGVEVATPLRHPVVLSEGTIPDRVRSAVSILDRSLPRGASAPETLPAAPSPAADTGEVLVLVSDFQGELDASALGVVSQVRRALGHHWPSVVWLGGAPSEAARFRLDWAGALAGYHVSVDGTCVDPTAAVDGFERVLSARPHGASAIFPSTPFGREVAGRLAARRGLGLVGDAIGIREAPDGGLNWSKPSFGGGTLASIHSRTVPVLATVRPGVFVPAIERETAAGFGWRELARVHARPRTELREIGTESEGIAELERRDVVVAVGMGVGGPEGVDRVRRLVASWNAGVVATRRVVDAGWVPRQLQLGLTGHALAPRLAVLLGVSGSPNHLAGWRRAGRILAVNADPAAPIFRAVDVGIVGSIEEVLPPLVEALRPLLSA